MATINAGNITKGMYIMYKGAPQQVTKAEFMAPGKGTPILRARFRGVKTGVVGEFTFKTNESVDIADVDKKEMQFLYKDGNSLAFMDPKTFDQEEVPAEVVGDQLGYLMPDMKCFVTWFEGIPAGVILPPQVTVTVTEAQDAVAGNRVNAPKKEVTVETGVKVMVPIFIKQGEKIILDTVNGEYVSRQA